MKKLLAALLLCAFCISFAACQPTPDEPFVVSKGDGKLMDIINSEAAPALTEPYQADAHWTETIDGKVEDRLTVNVDADVKVPQALEYPVYEAVYADYDQEAVEHFLNCTVGDVDLYVPNGYVTDHMDGIDLEGNPVYFVYPYANAKECQAIIDAIDYQLNDKNSPLNKYFAAEAPEEEVKTERDGLLEQQNMYQYFLEHQSEFLVKDEIDYPNLSTKIKHDNSPAVWVTSDGIQKIFIQKETDKRNMLAYMPEGVMANSVPDGEIDTFAKTESLQRVSIYVETAQAKADEWLKKLGLDGWDIANIGAAQLHTFNRYLRLHVYTAGSSKAGDDEAYKDLYADFDDPPEAYLFTYTPSKSDIPTLWFSNQMDNDYTNDDWRMPYLQVIVNDDGVKVVKLINGNSGLGECLSENVPLLPFEDIKEKFRDYITMNTDFTGWIVGDVKDGNYEATDRNLNNHEMTRIDIDDVRLGYVKIKIINTDKTMVVPAWCFYGQERNRFSENEYELQLDENNESYMKTPAGHTFLCINAIDGSIIDLTQGY